MSKVYLAGPDVFLPNAPAQAARKAEICARHGMHALPPLNEDGAGSTCGISSASCAGVGEVTLARRRQ